eukprot:scaffold1785_cov247-Pinguiococcus_pyrenoidosus.AAC.16
MSLSTTTVDNDNDNDNDNGGDAHGDENDHATHDDASLFLCTIQGYGQVTATNTGPMGIGLAKRELLHLDTIWFSQRYDRLTGGNFIIRSLDNVTGDGSGDDEVIHVDLQNAPPYVREITFVVNIYDKNKGFDRCRNSYIRLMLDAGGEGFGGKEVARFPITGRIQTNGLVFACLFRNGNDWNFRTIGEGCWGRHVLHEKGNTVQRPSKRSLTPPKRHQSATKALQKRHQSAMLWPPKRHGMVASTTLLVHSPNTGKGRLRSKGTANDPTQ